MSNRIVSVVSVPGGRWGYYAPAIYEAAPRKADGVVTWRCVGWPMGVTIRNGHRLRWGHRSMKIAIEKAKATGLPFVAGVRHGKAVSS